MEFNWSAENYRNIINDYLGYRNNRRPRGAVKGLAEKIRCHPTFIAQVLKERADFSPEQGFEICNYFSFSADQQDFFLTILMRDRSGTECLKQHFQEKLNFILEAKRDISPKQEASDKLLNVYESEYFGNWFYQAIHASTQITSSQTIPTIARSLNLQTKEVKAVMARLQIMGLVTNEKTLWKSTQNSLHLSKDSHFVRYLHATWKAKLLSDLQSKSVIEGTRYSGLITVTEKDYQKVRDVLVNSIGQIRKIVENSNSEGAYILSLDCYKL